MLGDKCATLRRQSGIVGPGENHRLDQRHELIAGRGAQETDPRVLIALQQNDGRDLLDPILPGAILFEHEVHFFERKVIVEADDLVQHLFGNHHRVGSAKGLGEEEQSNVILDDREMTAYGLPVLFRKQRHGTGV